MFPCLCLAGYLPSNLFYQTFPAPPVQAASCNLRSMCFYSLWGLLISWGSVICVRQRYLARMVFRFQNHTYTLPKFHENRPWFQWPRETQWRKVVGFSNHHFPTQTYVSPDVVRPGTLNFKAFPGGKSTQIHGVFFRIQIQKLVKKMCVKDRWWNQSNVFILNLYTVYG